MKRTIGIATFLLVAAHLTTGSAQESGWRMAPPMPEPQSEMTSAALGDKWYVFGGIDVPATQPVGTVMVYDAASKSWSHRNNMRVPAHHTAAVTLNGKIYVFGGFVGHPGTKVWQPIAD